MGSTNDSTTTLQIQGILDRLGAGDGKARDELFARAYPRLQQMASRALGPHDRLRAWEDSGDVLQDAAKKLSEALASITPRSPREFFGLAALHIRRVLIDLARHHFATEGSGNFRVQMPNLHEPAEGTSQDPVRLAQWTEIHEKLAMLPAGQRELVDLLFYGGLTMAEAAAVLDVDESTVKRRWRATKVELHDLLTGLLPGEARFKLSAQALEVLEKKDAIPAAVLTKLKQLQGRGFEREKTFLEALSKHLSAEELQCFRGQLLSRASAATS